MTKKTHLALPNCPLRLLEPCQPLVLEDVHERIDVSHDNLPRPRQLCVKLGRRVDPGVVGRDALLVGLDVLREDGVLCSSGSRRGREEGGKRDARGKGRSRGKEKKVGKGQNGDKSPGEGRQTHSGTRE